MTQPENVIFWGAGATQALGIRTTKAQEQAIQHLAGPSSSGDPVEKRVAKVLGLDGTGPWHSALSDLITILGDTAELYASMDSIGTEQLSAMRRNWRPGATESELRSRIIGLRLIYDWPALKSAVAICPGSGTDRFKINDLFNLLDMHIPQGFGFRGLTEQRNAGAGFEEQFLDARRLIGARNALRMILTALFYIDYHVCVRDKPNVLAQYFDFARQIGRRMQGKGVQLAGGEARLDQAEFYEGDIGFVSLNYDPICLWMQFIAHRELNASGAVPHIGSPAIPLHLYHDFGHLIPARGIGQEKANSPWYPLNEAAAQRLNELKYPSGYRVRLTKFLFPHGCLCWRECPDCGKLSAYHGDSWDRHAVGLFSPPPLRAFDLMPVPNWVKEGERTEREKGKVDARACLHCSTMTYAHHTQTVMQSSFKSPPPSFIGEIQRELRATIMRANHIIFMGYSLPPDDVTYRAFFSASCLRSKDRTVHCTIVDKNKTNNGWLGPPALKSGSLSEEPVVQAAKDIFGEDKVRFYGGGIPNVFLDETGQATQASWNSF